MPITSPARISGTPSLVRAFDLCCRSRSVKSRIGQSIGLVNGAFFRCEDGQTVDPSAAVA